MGTIAKRTMDMNARKGTSIEITSPFLARSDGTSSLLCSIHFRDLLLVYAIVFASLMKPRKRLFFE